MDVIQPPLPQSFGTKIEFIIIGLSAQIKKNTDPSIHLSNNSSSTTFTSDASVCNLGVAFDPHLSFSNHISNLSRSCLMHIRRGEVAPLILFFNFQVSLRIRYP